MGDAVSGAIAYDATWPESWQYSHKFDRLEIWGEDPSNGYARMYKNRRQQVLGALARLCPTPGRILDIAAAAGNFTIGAAALGHHVTWNDFRGELADYVALKAPEGAAIDYVAGNILDQAAVLQGRFDLVLALEVIEHVAHPDQFLRAIGALVRPGGHIILSTPNGGYLMNDLPRFSDFDDPSVFEDVQFKPDADGHIFLLHEDEVRRLSASAGLDLIEHRLFNFPLTCGYLKTGPIARHLPDGLVRAAEGACAILPATLRRKLATASMTILRQPDHA